MARFTGTGGGSGSGAPGPRGATGPQGPPGVNGIDGIDGSGFAPITAFNHSITPDVGLVYTLSLDNILPESWADGIGVRLTAINISNGTPISGTFVGGYIQAISPDRLGFSLVVENSQGSWNANTYDLWSMTLAGSRGATGPAGADGTGSSSGSGFNFLNEWQDGTTYALNDVVTYFNGTYIYVNPMTGASRPVDNFYGSANTNDWQELTPPSPSFKGTWQAGQYSYAIGDVVSFNGTLYIGTATGGYGPAGGQSPDSLGGWIVFIPASEGFNWRGTWESLPLTSYLINDVVEANGTSYIALTNNSGFNPVDAPFGHWDIFTAAGEGFNFRGVYDSMTNYAAFNDIVSYGNGLYISSNEGGGLPYSFNNKTPGDTMGGGASYWEVFVPAAAGFNYRGAFDQMTAYAAFNDVVSYLGALYISSNESGSSFSYRTPGDTMSGGASYWDVLVPAAAGFNYRGTWSSMPMGAYVANDVVVYGGGSYVARTLQAGMTYAAGTGTPGTQSGWGVLSSGFKWRGSWSSMPMDGTYAAGDVVSYGASIYVAAVGYMSTNTPGSGTPGDMMMNGWQTMLSGFNWRGAWEQMPMTSYAKGDIVSYSGSSYLAISDSIWGNPDSSASSWALLASAGESPNWRGEWDSNVYPTAAVNDIFSYNGSSYVFANAMGSPTSAPDTGGMGWNLVAAKGDIGPAGPFGAAGSYISTISQGPYSADSIQAMQLDAALWQNGVVLQNNSELQFDVSGKYNIAFSVQITQTVSNGNINIWLSKNGTAVEWSNTHVYVSANTPDVVTSWNFFIDAAAGDFYQIMWSSDSANTVLDIHPATGSGATYHPAVPSVIMTVNQVG